MNILIAPSFKSYTLIGEPYIKGSKQYIQAKNEKTGNIREIRVYSEKEYRKIYPEKFELYADPNRLKKPRGFYQDFIYLFAKKNEPFNEDDHDYILRTLGGRYAVDVGYYHTSDEDFKPTLDPNIYKILKLSWNSFIKYFGQGDSQEGKGSLSRFIKSTHPNLHFCFGNQYKDIQL